jgi:predicted alpha/beta-hydrolase family hydrolase
VSSNAQPVSIAVSESISVSGLLQRPHRPLACIVLAHGAGAGMEHPFMAAVAAGLARREIASLRYQFPYREAGRRRPDPPGLAHAAARAAVAAAARLVPKLPLIAGGKSYGGRMTSQAQAEGPLPGVIGLAFLGFPLHPAGKPSQDRGKHLFDVQVPTVLQGLASHRSQLHRTANLCRCHRGFLAHCVAAPCIRASARVPSGVREMILGVRNEGQAHRPLCGHSEDH